jgi:uncharacterized protein YutE (UPF0331/DUF86 family)
MQFRFSVATARSRSLSISIARAAGFRNVLVHQYADVDDNAVVANLGLVDELEAYAESLTAWANDRSEQPPQTGIKL